MSNDRPLHMLHKIVLPETTLYAYRNDTTRVEVVVSHATEWEWFLTIRLITIVVGGDVSDILWKWGKTNPVEVDWKFSEFSAAMRGGLTPMQITQDLFLEDWGCIVLDENLASKYIEGMN